MGSGFVSQNSAARHRAVRFHLELGRWATDRPGPRLREGHSRADSGGPEGLKNPTKQVKSKRPTETAATPSDCNRKGGSHMRHHTKDKGDLAVGQVIADLLKEGIHVCLPLSEHLPFDLIAVSPSMQDLCRVQVRYAVARNGVVSLALRRTHADRHGVHNKRIRLHEIDAFAIFCPDVRVVYYVRCDEITAGMRSSFALRLRRARNGQVRKTRSAENFEGAWRIFGPVAQWTEPSASNRLDGGSIPSGPAKPFREILRLPGM